VTAGDLVLEVENASDFGQPDDGETADLLLSGLMLAYSDVLYVEEPDDAVTVDTIVLAAAAPIDVGLNERVDVPGKARYIAQVYLNGATNTTPAELRHNLVKARALKRLSGELGADVILERDSEGNLWVTDLDRTDPSDDGAAIADETLALSTAADPDDLADQNFLSTIARAGSAYGVPLDNPIITALNSDGDGLRWDGPGGFLSLSRGNAVQVYFSALRSYLGGQTDLTEFTALVGRIRTSLDFEPGSSARLRSQYQPPEAPTVQVGWPLIGVLDLPHFDATFGSSKASLWYLASTNRYWLFSIRPRRNADAGRTLQAWSYDNTGGDKTKEWEVPLGAYELKDGVARIGSSWFFAVLPTPDNSVVAVQERDNDGAIVNQWAATTISSETEVCIGRDAAGNVLLLWDDHSTSWDLQTYATTGGAPSATLTLSPGGGAAGFVGSDTYDFGATRIVTGIGNAGDGCWVYTTAGVEQVGDEWTQTFADEWQERICIAATWNDDDDCWVNLADDGKFVRYTSLEKAAGWEVDVDVSAVVTLRDGSGNETDYDSAKVAAFTVNGRQQIVVNAPTVPPGSGMRYCLYLATGASPTRTDFHLFGTPASGDNSWTVEAIPTATANPPSTNTMPSGTSTSTGA
jgi:hypothetical protein